MELIKAIMMQESRGLGSDPMQCSESSYYTRYPRTPGGITEPEYSIDVGVQTIADLSYRTVYDCFKRVMVKLGHPEARFHDLCHTYAVAAIKSGDDIKTVQENLGHATAAFTLDVYGHVTSQMKQASASRMEQFISAVSS